MSWAYDDYGEPLPPRMGPLPHSGPGVASFIVAIIGGLLMLGVIGFATVIEMNDPGVMLDEHSREAMLVGLGMLFAGFVTVTGLILGIVGLAQGERNKLFAILGTALASLVLVGTACLIAIGLTDG